MTERWTVRPEHDHGGTTRWHVHDAQDADRSVAEFDDEVAARAHAERLAGGPFDLDEQDRREAEGDDWGRPDRRIPWDDGQS
jgi:hypothetical protein